MTAQLQRLCELLGWGYLPSVTGEEWLSMDPGVPIIGIPVDDRDRVILCHDIKQELVRRGYKVRVSVCERNGCLVDIDTRATNDVGCSIWFPVATARNTETEELPPLLEAAIQALEAENE